MTAQDIATPPPAKKGRKAPVPSWKPIYDGLMSAIVHHRIDPGTRLAEEDLAEVYGVSRTVVRSALQTLAQDGVLIIERNKGARVARPTPEEAREIFETRALIEPQIARLASARMTPAALGRLEASIEAEHRALAIGDANAALFQSAEFHRLIAEIAGQSVLARILGELMSRSSLVIALYWSRREALCDDHAHHALVGCFARGEGEAAADLMRRHVELLGNSLDLTRPAAPTLGLADVLKAVR
ncbi:GntR family transcriptional regulator [Aureimonas sp. AU20]|uniref:GntR family transcriptional regulator n=1 Tax=Aureimonas sp. AU20 TaxID=1349819 RepID=UPI000720EA9E|nr:GntR family transcriptional regulator [Aureimonas sp. AU20]ALN72214.1 hypothetical protein M673_05770 [Aureimonas sp. AU20]